MLTNDTLAFLTELRSHNDRRWFESNKERYEASVKEPMLSLVAELGPRIRAVSRHMVVDPRPTGGSLMRIYRDIRFSKDKSPYKTHMAAMFWHAKGKESSTPGYYLHVEPGETMLGGGVWHPDGSALKGIRDRIAKDSAQWRSATSGLLKKSACGMIGATLKRPPAGYAPDHPLIDDLKRKDFAFSMRFSDAEALSPKFAASVADGAGRMAPFMAFLAKAVGVPF
jgi:uncharacterized protein (TIGR02453 family)